MSACSALPTAKAHGTQATTLGFVFLPQKEKTMTHKQARVRQQRQDQTPQIHIPHSSWSRVERNRSAEAVLAPGDFWARLGL